MAADSADFQRLYTLSRVATNRQQPPPPASQALEPRCAWNGDNFRTRPQGNGLLAFSDERSSSGWKLSDRALDPYTYARRAACAADGRGTQNRVRYTDARMPEQRAPEREHFVERSGGQTARGTERRALQQTQRSPEKSLANAKLSAVSKNRAADGAEKKGAKGKGSPVERPRTPAAEAAASGGTARRSSPVRRYNLRSRRN
ncbi:hypothetical protein HPB50_027825 [Hyalomma asiaticum]|nr:hypothetical protein HPB50_027825 [Hyalomma asiaticum]